MNEFVSVFLPVRKGSKRIENKNTKPFSIYKGGLLELKLKQLLEIENIGEIILSTNDPEAINVAKSLGVGDKKFVIKKRPKHLAQDNTDLSDLVAHVPQVTNREHILWTHVTSPFVTSSTYKEIINCYFEATSNNYDSLMSVSTLQNFVWDKEINDIINRVNEFKWPRTQDLKTLYEVNSAAFMASKNIYNEYNDRIGESPYLFELGKIEAIDIDWHEDFKIAEMIYENI
jgi:N-acylneuraminate cytidylyltransferase